MKFDCIRLILFPCSVLVAGAQCIRKEIKRQSKFDAMVPILVGVAMH